MIKREHEGGTSQPEYTLAKPSNCPTDWDHLTCELLSDMGVFPIEHLVKRLLETLDYQNLLVTTRCSDPGVQVVTEIELSATSVGAVLLVKRHRRTIQRIDLDAPCTSRYRINAVPSIVMATSRISKGDEGSAGPGGTDWVTVIDGDRLIDLPTESGIGVRKRTLEEPTVEPDALAALERGA